MYTSDQMRHLAAWTKLLTVWATLTSTIFIHVDPFYLSALLLWRTLTSTDIGTRSEATSSACVLATSSLKLALEWLLNSANRIIRALV